MPIVFLCGRLVALPRAVFLVEAPLLRTVAAVWSGLRNVIAAASQRTLECGPVPVVPAFKLAHSTAEGTSPSLRQGYR